MFGLSAAERGVESAVAIIKPMFALVSAAGKTLTPHALREPLTDCSDCFGLAVTRRGCPTRPAETTACSSRWPE